jgi:antitoxin (DNA-binding transcriptional repressor) of toxin-antitoxin stability system
MTKVTLEKAQQDLPALVRRVLAGEEIVIEADGMAVRLAPCPTESEFDAEVARRRGYGVLKGHLVVGPEFFEPLPGEECGHVDEKSMP